MTTPAEYVDRVRSSVPPQLLCLPVWLGWKAIDNGDKKPRKVPFYIDGEPRNGALDAPGDRDRLVSFETAASAFIRASFTGLGVALGDIPGEELHLAGIDLDDVSLEDARVLEILAAANSYAEISPSGKGLKIFGLGNIGKADVALPTGGLEIYCEKRFFTVTGLRLNGAHLADLSDAARLARALWKVCDDSRGVLRPVLVSTVSCARTATTT